MSATKFSLSVALLAGNCIAGPTLDSHPHLRRQLQNVAFCNPVALSTDPITGLPNYSEDVFFAAFTNGAPLDGFALQYVMPSSYNGIVDCSYMLGSTRELLECEIVEGVLSKGPNVFLVKCAYLTNSKDGANVIENFQEMAVSKCACICEEDRKIAGLLLDSQCNCFCNPQKYDCECMAPNTSVFVSAINAAYVNSTIGETTEARITSIYRIDPLDFDDCDAPNSTTFNSTGFCLGLETAAVSNHSTRPPSPSPTYARTQMPTNLPSESRKEFSTDSPSDYSLDGATVYEKHKDGDKTTSDTKKNDK
jgi:hypothetical protein